MSRPCRGCRWFNDRDGKCKNIYGPRFERSVGPNDSCGKHEKWPGLCGYTNGVVCGESAPESCLHCGWNPETAQKRLERREERRYTLKPDLRTFFSSEREYKEFLRQRKEMHHGADRP